MRHKQRPVKSSRHKSVTFIIDSQTSFAGQQQASGAGNSIIVGDQHLANRHPKSQNNSQSLLLDSPAPSSSAFSTNPHKRPQNDHQRPQRSTSLASYGSASSSSHNNNNNNNNQSTSGSSPASYNNATNRSSMASLRMPTIAPSPPQTKTILATNDSDTSREQSLLRKQFEHNNGYRHMSDVMRLAFLENNDISIDDCASTLQRKIRQQLLQEQCDQLQFRQQNKQQQQHNYRQQQRHQQQKQRQQHNQNHRQVSYHDPDADADFDDVNDYDGDQDVDDYEISDSRIFATASTPTGSSSSVANIRTNLGTSTPKSVIQQRQRQRQQQQLLHQQQQQQLQQLQQQFQLQQPSGSGVHHNQHNRHHAGNVIEANDIDVSIKRRPRDSVQRVEFPNRVETLQNYGEGFFCDEPGCGKSFPSLRKLRHHKVVHSDDFPFICEFNGCAKKFKRKFGIDLHSTTHFDLDPEMYSKTSNNSSLPFFGRRMQYSMCKPCGQKFKTVHEYQYHMLKHGKEPFKCPVKGCGQTFGIWKSFQKHRASHYFNYYCKMDPQCTHHTSNLQLLKLHIYCCHFRRKLPENATLASRDPEEDESARSEHVEVAENEDTPHASIIKDEDEDAVEGEGDELEGEDEDGSESISVADSPPKRPEPSTPRRDSRLRKNPPRSSTFGQQDYASINNGSSFIKSITSTPTPKKTRSTLNSSDSSAVGSQLVSHDKTDNSIEMSIKKRPRETVQRVDISNDTSVETAQNYCEGFFCDEPSCGKSFPSLRKLRHHKVVHSDDFPFICEFNGCAKKFKRKFGIDLHSTTHFDLDPEMYSKTSNNSSLPFFGRRMQYSMCKPCGQKFKTVHEYQYHMLKHGKEPFKCPVKGCGQTFGIWKSFQKHRASHYFNYYCKMDPQCTHHTSNLQLLKLHIYCCHFRRKLPENATLASRDPEEDDSVRDEHIDVVDGEDLPQNVVIKSECDEDEEESISVASSPPKQPEPSTPRRDSRLRKNPPRSSTFGQQDYASINNGSSFAKSTTSTPTLKRTRATLNSSGPQSVESPSTPPEKKMKLPLKVLPKRSAQRLPMSLIADDASTEDDEVHSSEGGSSMINDRDEDEEMDVDPTKRHKFKCHLCDYQFSVRFQLTKHLSTHLELTPEMYSATADKQVVQLSERRRREFYCDKCSVKFEHMQDLDGHMRKHGTRPYVCHFCQVPSTFRLAKQYLSHLYEHRFNYKCTMEPDCDFTINRKDALKLHIFRMHLNQQLPSYIENFANMIDEWPEQ